MDAIFEQGHEIRSLANLFQIIRNYSEYKKEYSDSRIFMYRGQSSIDFSLKPSIFRDKALENEAKMILELKRLAPHEFINLNSNLEQLIKMQHYGLPTRLLDITSNPLVALFFACDDLSQSKKDGELIVFYDYFTPLSEQVELYAKLSSFEGHDEKDFIKFTSFKDGSFYDEQKNINREKLKRIFPLKYLLITPPLNNERIRRQHGAFLIFGLDVEKQNNPFQKESFDIKDEITKEHDDGICRYFIIPHSSKKTILEELDSIGINRAFLFPEFEHQAAYVKQKYFSSQSLSTLDTKVSDDDNSETDSSFESKQKKILSNCSDQQSAE